MTSSLPRTSLWFFIMVLARRSSSNLITSTKAFSRSSKGKGKLLPRIRNLWCLSNNLFIVFFGSYLPHSPGVIIHNGVVGADLRVRWYRHLSRQFPNKRPSLRFVKLHYRRWQVIRVQRLPELLCWHTPWRGQGVGRSCSKILRLMTASVAPLPHSKILFAVSNRDFRLWVSSTSNARIGSGLFMLRRATSGLFTSRSARSVR